jgi:hypothetical protein
MHNLLCDLQLHSDVTNGTVTPTFQQMSHVVKEPIKSLTQVGVSQKAMPHPLHHLNEP